MTTEASNHSKYLIATKVIDFANDQFRIILMEYPFSFNKDTHHNYADVSADELGSGNGYTATGNLLAPSTVTEDDANDRAEVTWPNTQWTAGGGPIGPAAGAIIYDDTVANDPIVGYIDFGASYTQADGGTATLSSIAVRLV